MLNNLKSSLLNKSGSYRHYKREYQRLEQEITNLKAKNQELATENQALLEENKIYTANTENPPGHFYSPLPDVEDIKSHAEDSFSRNKILYGMNINDKKQLEFLDSIASFYNDFIYEKENIEGYRYKTDNGNFGFYCGITLYGMLRTIKPNKLIEVGCGWSTCLTLDTNEKIFNNKIDTTFIEPYPDLLYDIITEEDKKTINIMESKLQDVDLKVFKGLNDGDILFIDSTHVTKMDSDVNYIIHTILPNLNKGVYVHFHDICYPFEYPDYWVYNGKGWNEAYILRAFLEMNDSYEIVYMTTYIKDKHNDKLKKLMPECAEDLGASIWIKKVK